MQPRLCVDELHSELQVVTWKHGALKYDIQLIPLLCVADDVFTSERAIQLILRRSFHALNFHATYTASVTSTQGNIVCMYLKYTIVCVKKITSTMQGITRDLRISFWVLHLAKLVNCLILPKTNVYIYSGALRTGSSHNQPKINRLFGYQYLSDSMMD